MKKLDLGQAIGILANVGVIAGIVFLGLELRQNNSLLEAEAAHNLLQNRIATSTLILENPEVAELFVKIESGEPLTPAEDLRVDRYLQTSILKWQWEFSESLAGRIDVLPLAGYRQQFHDGPLGSRRQEQWAGMKHILPPDFVEWFEDNVANVRE